jgi:hypothetical protein
MCVFCVLIMWQIVCLTIPNFLSKAMQGGTTKLDINFGKNFQVDSLPSAPSAVDRSGKVIIKMVKDVEKEYKTKGRSSIITRSSIIKRNSTITDPTKINLNAVSSSPPPPTVVTAQPVPLPPTNSSDSSSSSSSSSSRQKRRSVAVLSRRGMKVDTKQKPNKSIGFCSSVWMFLKRLFGCTRHTSSSSSSSLAKEKERPRSARLDLATLGRKKSDNMFSGSNPFSKFQDDNTDL